jgi:hypothetical protein
MAKSTPTWLQDMQRDALQARRTMVRNGELLSADELCRRRGISSGRLARMLESGSVFSVEVDGVEYYPALLADPAYNSRRLAALCRILWPVEPMSRLGFLTTRRGSLGDMTPLEAMQTGAGYRRVREVAKAWAAE